MQRRAQARLLCRGTKGGWQRLFEAAGHARRSRHQCLLRITAATNWYCDAVAKFVLDLQATKDADGSSILDNTIVVLASEVGQYHEFTTIPMAVRRRQARLERWALPALQRPHSE
jgi:hypothetical protein